MSSLRLTFIYDYLFHPFQTLEKHQNAKPVAEALLALLLAGLALMAEFGVGLSVWSLPLLVILLIIQAFFIFIQSTFLDFIAQMFKLKPQSLGLFYWLALSLMPFLLGVPIALMATAYPAYQAVFELASFAILIWVTVLQIGTIKTIYQTTTLKSVFVYFFPFIFLACMLAGTLFLAGIVGVYAASIWGSGW